MFYLTQFLGVPVLDAAERSIGVLEDFIFTAPQEQDCPVVAAILLRRGEKDRQIAWEDVSSLTLVQVVLQRKQRQIQHWSPDPGEFFKGRDALNEIVVDENQVPVGKVTDLALERLEEKLVVRQVEVTGETFWHRLGLMRIKNILVPRLKERGQRFLIPWQAIACTRPEAGKGKPSGAEPAAWFQAFHGSAGKITPDELVSILRKLPVYLRRDFLFSLSSNEMVELLEQLDPEEQVELSSQSKVKV